MEDNKFKVTLENKEIDLWEVKEVVEHSDPEWLEENASAEIDFRLNINIHKTGIDGIDVWIDKVRAAIHVTHQDDEAFEKEIIVDTTEAPWSDYNIKNKIEVTAGGHLTVSSLEIDFKRKEITLE